jgi:hypothetical protein
MDLDVSQKIFSHILLKRGMTVQDELKINTGTTWRFCIIHKREETRNKVQFQFCGTRIITALFIKARAPKIKRLD